MPNVVNALAHVCGTCHTTVKHVHARIHLRQILPAHVGVEVLVCRVAVRGVVVVVVVHGRICAVDASGKVCVIAVPLRICTRQGIGAAGVCVVHASSQAQVAGIHIAHEVVIA